MDNGPELIAWILQDWCRLRGLGTIYIEPGSPWQNPWVESFNNRVRDELLNITEFGSLTEARVIIEDWRNEYNTWRPHSSSRRTHPRRVRRPMPTSTPADTPITPGPTTGAPSPG
jgi:putative transposase